MQHFSNDFSIFPNRNASVNQTVIAEKSYPFLNDTTRMDVSTTAASATTTTEPKRYAGLTYVPGLTEQLSKKLKSFAPNLTIAPRPPVKVSKLFSDMKEKLRPGQCSCVVYGIPCGGCKSWYYGETTWSVDNRCKLGHVKDLKNIKNKPRKTALVHHTNTTKHQFDFEKKKIMKKVRSRRTLKIHEVNQIILNEHQAVNFKSDAEHVSPEFYNLIMGSVKPRHTGNMNNSRRKKVNLTEIFNETPD